HPRADTSPCIFSPRTVVSIFHFSNITPSPTVTGGPTHPVQRTHYTVSTPPPSAPAEPIPPIEKQTPPTINKPMSYPSPSLKENDMNLTKDNMEKKTTENLTSIEENQPGASSFHLKKEKMENQDKEPSSLEENNKTPSPEEKQ
ncbi:MAG: hypothetical protein OXH36_02350, partial [Bdellovibrionales bacterium]|nr:hypothetical protein [Bdellovibrionales bacterium]